MIDDDCAGAGRCHGCMAWCDRCGDVGNVCDNTSGTCDCHFCPQCHRGPTLIRDDACEPCQEQEWIEGIEQRMIRAVERGDDAMARKHAATIREFNQRERIAVEFVRWDGAVR